MSVYLATLFFHLVAILSGAFLMLLTDIGVMRSMLPSAPYEQGQLLSEEVKPFILLFGLSTLFYLLFR